MTVISKKSSRQKTGFIRNQRGNITIISAVTMFPILAVSGFALDFRTTQNRQDDVQAALDAAVLAAARALQQGESIADVKQDVADVMAKITADTDMGLSCQGGEPLIPNTKASVYARYECQQDTSLSAKRILQMLDPIHVPPGHLHFASQMPRRQMTTQSAPEGGPAGLHKAVGFVEVTLEQGPAPVRQGEGQGCM